MYKQTVYFLMIMMAVFMVGCNNESSLEPEDPNIEPQNVSFGGPDEEIPVNPGREQNIFEDANPSKWFRQEDRNYGADVRNRQTTQEKMRQTEENMETEVQDEDYLDRNEEPESFDRPSLDGYVQKVVELTNQARNENGVDTVNFDHDVANVAQNKAEEMADRNYFSHTSPTYGSPFDMLKAFDVEYTRASENIAAGQSTPEEVVESWLHSEGHRKNLLDPNVSHIGVGYSPDGNYWTQMFIRK
ncbi:CAP domain-containing protein [Gracilibacillus sp. S3-1-1]|uniref:CAP domain-containing protein n=1 Tax=Gracilibacillus pellucidus TaxID=3095368 RepID=A0ACC6M2Y3_9BACI|nr:CAP domain-containing protein [Gracilibacillus sp. S3-1-1]MDX8045212.1 CAP domain-containing protein [Gracilibacillus sp. S3-1-1]